MQDRRWIRNGLAVMVGLLVSLAAVGQEDISLCRQGWSSYSAGQYDEALRLYEECTRTGQLTTASVARSYRNMGLAYHAKKDPARSIDFYNKALALKPDDFWSDYINRGNAWSDLKEYDKALADYETALKAKSDLGSAYYNRGIVYERLDKAEAAKADFAQAYAKGYRAPALTERMAHYQLPTEDSVTIDRNKPIESTEILAGLLLQVVKESNGKHSCFEKQLSLAEVRPAVQELLRRQRVTAPTADQATLAFYTLYPCPFSPVRAELKAATQKDLEGVWLVPESSYKYRHPPQSVAWKQEPPASLKMCDGIGFYADEEMRVTRRGGATGSCPFRKAGDMDVARQFPRTSSWNMIRDGRLSIRRSDVANHVEEWDMFVATADFEARGLQVKQGDLLGYMRKVPGNDWNIASMFWHLQKLPQ